VIESGQVVHLQAVRGHPRRLDAVTEHAAYGVEFTMTGVRVVVVADQGDLSRHVG